MSLKDSTNRRRFLQDSAMLAGLPPLCCKSPEAPRDSMSFDGQRLILEMARIPELHNSGGAVAAIDPERNLNLIVARIAKNHFVAIDRTCTHGGGMCTYNHQRGSLQCTSLNHAEYDLRGNLLHGRTHGNLRAYGARLIRGRIEIELGRRQG